MKSPVNDIGSITLIKKIKVSKIVKLYKNHGIDVSKYFANLDTANIYKCKDTGYQFYYPFNIAGDSDFYIYFQQFDWYYMPWKWEHEISLNYIKEGDAVLEIGCARGQFLERVVEFKKAKCIGLELNESVTRENSDLKIINTTIEKFSKENQNKFDIVCSYQVLEHVSSVNSFIEASISCIKGGGKLIISVPNNDSFIGHSNNCLNMPPHHMGLWNEQSLKALENYFDVKLMKTIKEPLQTYHTASHMNSLLQSKFSRYPAKILMKILKISRIGKLFEKRLIKKAETISGHSIIAIFEKL